jgi:hypothetical protein
MTTDNLCFYWQNGLIQTSQTGGQWYSDTSPISIPWLILKFCAVLNVKKTYRHNLLAFVAGRSFHPSLMFVGKAGSLPYVGAPKRCSSQVGVDLTCKD